MDQIFWATLIDVVVANFMVPFLPWMWATRAAITAAAAATQPWWIVLIAANLGGLPALIIMTWTVRHSYLRIARWWPQLALPASQQGPTVRLLLISASPFPEYATALYAGTQPFSWTRFCLVVTTGRMLHHLPIVLSGLLLGQQSWFQTGLVWARHPLVILGTALAGFLWWKLRSRTTKPQTAQS